ncbi:dephospho-CoA kinase [uncultured Anaerococcus sp.]|uniref:dephospho-CoA kinase n=1 Tax=uncultured Anaerococcus sp. TaxID=293428 RepID=UPI0025D7DF52|nr:dephospho-CoA kinase [uncultured Anaerococcus sp.]
MSPNKIVITGTIGSGKSAVSEIIKNLGFSVINADFVNKKLLERGGENYEAIKADPFFRKAFKGDMLDKKKLAKMIFQAPDLMKRLNSLTHPIIIGEIEKEISQIKEDYVFVEIPLYYQMEVKFPADLVLFVEASNDIQAERLSMRDDIGSFYAKSKIKNQEDLMGERDEGEIIIENNGSLENLKEEIIKILRTEKIYENN